MGEFVEVNPAQLRAVANRVMAAAEQVAQLRRPALEPDAMPGSCVGEIAAPVLVAARLTEVVENLREWAGAAHMSADSFERTERRNGERFSRE
ncbi:MAG TPA: hypothetical protein VHH12_10525 [Mycobacterium sp.]|nr:hypothetical protein [Mycobacterium sp.]